MKNRLSLSAALVAGVAFAGGCFHLNAKPLASQRLVIAKPDAKAQDFLRDIAICKNCL